MPFLKKIIVFILTLESRLILRKYKPFIVAITGSVGKTSTKDAIFEVMRSPAVCKPDGGICYVRKSEKSMNSEIGLPLTIIGAPNAWYSVAGWSRNIIQGLKLIIGRAKYPDCLILEVGADHPGDIRKVMKWLRPDIAVITRISRRPVHVEFFKSPDEVFAEKATLVHGLKKGGAAIIYADDDKLLALADDIKAKGVKVVTFGVSDKAEVRATDYKVHGSGFSFNLQLDGNSHELALKNIVGRSYIYPLLAAAAIGKAKGIQPGDIVQALNNYEGPKGRMNVIQGINNSTIMDDSYNSSPDAAVSALETLREMGHGKRKIAILGEMMELGKYSAEEHRNIGREAAEVLKSHDGHKNSGILITVGQRSRGTAEEAIKSGLTASEVYSFDTAEEAADFIQPLSQSGDVILVKGSQSVRTEKIVEKIMAHPEEAAKLLVRQEKEWLEK